MAKLIDKLRQLLQQKREELANTPQSMASGERASSPEIIDSQEALTKLMRLLQQTDEVEYSCQETFALLDEYVELVNSSQEAVALMPIVKHHIDMCPDCGQAFQTLLRILQTEK